MRFVVVFAATLSLAACQPADDPWLFENDPAWVITVDTAYYGELDGRFVRDPGTGRLVTGRTLAAYLSDYASNGVWFPDGTIASIELTPRGGDRWRGTHAALTATHDNGAQPVDLRASGDGLTGEIAAGSPFSGLIAGMPVAQPDGPLRDYPAIHANLLAVMRQHLFDPRLIHAPEAGLALEIMSQSAHLSEDDYGFVLGYAFATPRLTFSHFGVSRPAAGLDGLLAQRQARGVGGDEVELRYEAGGAILTVNSFIGDYIGAQIDTAFEEIHAASPDFLVVDLRQNSGGSLAGRHVASHLVSETRIAGAFVGAAWSRAHGRPPTPAEIANAPVWAGDTLEAFYEAVDESPIFAVEVPAAPTRFSGQVYVLQSRQSSSMTEMLLAAIKPEQNVVLVGEVSAGEMLSSRFFDIGESYVARIPVADYYTAAGLRLEAQGVEPEIGVAADEALERAFSEAGVRSH